MNLLPSAEAIMAISFIGAHFLGDWILQNRVIAENKSKSWTILMCHVCIVGAILCIPMMLLGMHAGYPNGHKFLGYLVAHGLQDRYIWKFYEKKYHDPANPDRKGKAFYNTIAIDQFIHLSLLMYLFL